MRAVGARERFHAPITERSNATIDTSGRGAELTVATFPNDAILTEEGADDFAN